jgi:putative nucleotidyltransferase with HDIG domain
MDILKGFLPDGIPTLPIFVERLLETINEDFFTAQDLEKIISQDAAMSAKMLKIANSALFGLSGMVGTLGHAIVLLGTKFIQALAIGLPLIDAGIYEKSGGPIPWRHFWSHSFATAWTGFRCVQLRYLTGVKEDAFVIGLLHDIGKPILWMYRAEEYQDVIELVGRGNRCLPSAERTVLGFDHAELGGELANYWSLPESIYVAIASHHDEPTDDVGAALIQMADYVAHAAGFADGIRTADTAPTLAPDVAERIGQRNLQALICELQEKHSEVGEMVSLLSRTP